MRQLTKSPQISIETRCQVPRGHQRQERLHASQFSQVPTKTQQQRETLNHNIEEEEEEPEAEAEAESEAEEEILIPRLASTNNMQK